MADLSAGLAATPRPAALQLRGEPRCVVAAGAAVPLEASDALMLAYLCLEGPTSRARLATLLWPDADEGRARGNLRQRLLRLRKSVGAEIVTGRAQLAIAAHVTHDASGDAELLASIAPEQAGGLGEWLDAARSSRRQVRLDALAAEASRLEADQRIARLERHRRAGGDDTARLAAKLQRGGARSRGESGVRVGHDGLRGTGQGATRFRTLRCRATGA